MRFLNNIKNWFMALSKFKRVIIFILVFSLFSTGAAGAFVWHRLSDIEGQFDDVLNPVKDPNQEPGGDVGDDEIIDIDEAFRDQKVLNILLIGFDRNKARAQKASNFLSDTLMLASINLGTGRIDVISIPRDSLVRIYKLGGGGIDKINTAGYYGRISTKDKEQKDARELEYTINTVSMALGGITIHYYVSIDMDGVIEAVNIMGGVWYDVPKNVYDRKGKLIVEEGYQKLNGRQFLLYARNRQYSSGDYQRVQNQQDLLLATFSQFKKSNNLIKAPQVLVSMKNDIRTNLSLEQMASLALFATNKIDRENIHQHVVAGKYGLGRRYESQKGVRAYWIINNAKRAELLKLVWGINIKVEPDIVLLPRLVNEPDHDDSSDHDEPNLGEDPSQGDSDDPGQGANEPSDSSPGGD